MEFELLEIILTALGASGFGGLGYLVKVWIDRRKRNAEASGAEADNEIKLYAGYLSANKDKDEMIAFMSDQVKQSQMDLTILTVTYNTENRGLKRELDDTKDELRTWEKRHKEMEKRYNNRITELENKLTKLMTELTAIRKENERLKDENKRLKNGQNTG